MLNLTFSGPAEEVIADLKRIMPALIGATPLPPMQEQPKEDPQPQRTRRPRKTEEAGDANTGEQTAGGANSASDASASTASQTTSDTVSGSTGKPSTGGETAEIPDIDALRAALKKLGAAEGFGHDKVFEVLGEFNVKTASTLPEDKRAEVIGKIEKMLAEGPKK